MAIGLANAFNKKGDSSHRAIKSRLEGGAPNAFGQMLNSVIMKTIFLDIDGVLHPSTVGELEYGPRGPKVTGPGVCALEAKLENCFGECSRHSDPQYVDLHVGRENAANGIPAPTGAKWRASI